MKEISNEAVDMRASSEEILISDGSSPDDLQIVTLHRNTKYSGIDDIQKAVASNSFSSIYPDDDKFVTSKSRTMNQSLVTPHAARLFQLS